MSSVVVGFDGSANATYALGWAMRQATRERAELTVLAINEVAASPYNGAPAIMPQDAVMLEQARKGAEDAAAKAAAELGEANTPPVTVVAKNGFAAQELIAAARNADLLVLGSRGQLSFPALRLGTISTKVAQYVNCPVVFVPPVS
jgi:nucleotide-binding universal stress UspA family protein